MSTEINMSTNDPEQNPLGIYSRVLNPLGVFPAGLFSNPPRVQTLVSGSMMPVDTNYFSTGALVGIDPVNGGFVPLALIPKANGNGSFVLSNANDLISNSFTTSQVVTGAPISVIVNTAGLLHKTMTIKNTSASSLQASVTASINNGVSYDLILTAPVAISAGQVLAVNDSNYETNISINIISPNPTSAIVNFAGTSI